MIKFSMKHICHFFFICKCNAINEKNHYCKCSFNICSSSREALQIWMNCKIKDTKKFMRSYVHWIFTIGVRSLISFAYVWMLSYLFSHRQEKLEQLANRFDRKAGMRETWLSENQKLVSQDNFGYDLAAVEPATKKHEAIETDINAYEERVAGGGVCS